MCEIINKGVEWKNDFINDILKQMTPDVIKETKQKFVDNLGNEYVH